MHETDFQPGEALPVKTRNRARNRSLLRQVSVRSIALVRAWLKVKLRHRAILLLSGSVFVLVAGVAVTAFAMAQHGEAAPPVRPAGEAVPTAASTAAPGSTAAPSTAQSSPSPVPFAGILDGVPMTEAEWQARKNLLPVAVMIDNSPDAYPHAGLAAADLVYEGFVEGGITRFMAVYWRRETDYIEPVRSARTPFVIWADELGALYGHAGEADTYNAANSGGQLLDWKIFDLNAFAPVPSSAYYRDEDRYAPHNLVTGTNALRKAAAAVGFAGPPTVQPWTFKADGEATSTMPKAEGIEINFQGRRDPWQLIQWHWDSVTKSYGRYQFGGPHLDARTKQQLHFTNVIVARFNQEVVDDGGHVLLDQFGSGPATVFLDGRQIDGTWRKQDRKARLRFYDKTGNEIALDRGPIFIEVVGPQSTVTVAATAAELPTIPPYEPLPPSAPSEADDTAPPANPSQQPSPSPRPSASPSPTVSTTTTPVPTRTTAPPTSTPTVAPTRTPVPTPTPTIDNGNRPDTTVG